MSSGERFKVRITAGDLEIAYSDVIAVRADSLDITGGVIAVIGHNGAGKSTFIKCLLDLLPPQRGYLEARPLNDPALRLKAEEDMAFCPETGSVFADISVESYIKLWCRLKSPSSDFYKKEGSRFIDALFIEPLFKKLGRELSKGQRRRVQTAIGFLCSPKLFLFDEPFDGLDVQKTRELARLIEFESSRTAFIVSSHRMDVIERISDSVLVIKEGRFAASGAVPDVCRVLCPRTARLSNLQDMDAVEGILSEMYPKCVQTRHNAAIDISGDMSLEENGLRQALTRAGETNSAIEIRSSSLVDAMDYHLAGLERPKPQAA